MYFPGLKKILLETTCRIREAAALIEAELPIFQPLKKDGHREEYFSRI